MYRIDKRKFHPAGQGRGIWQGELRSQVWALYGNVHGVWLIVLLFLLFRSWDVSCLVAEVVAVVVAVSVVIVVVVAVEVVLMFVSGAELATVLSAVVGMLAAGTVDEEGYSLGLVPLQEVVVVKEGLTLAVS
jgi:hypothetical protein